MFIYNTIRGEIMKKICRMLFSHVTIIGFLLLLQFGFLILLVSALNYVYAEIQLVMIIIAIITLFSIGSRDMQTEAKNSWAIIVLLAPAFGTIAYILFSKNRLTKKQIKIIREVKKQSDAKINHKYELKIKEELDDNQYAQLQYLYSANKQIGYINSDLTFYDYGEKFYVDFIKELKEAKNFIFLEYFIIAPGKMLDGVVDILLEKVQKGVEVRFIYDDVGSASTIHSSFARALQKKGIKCYPYNRLRIFLSSIYNNRDHRKIAVIDGKVAFTGGLNLADEYINQLNRFGIWKDTAIKIKGEAVDSMTAMFLSNYAINLRKEEDFSKYLHHYTKTKKNGVIVPYGDGPKPFYNEYVGENVFLNMINGAVKYVYITTPYLICDNKLLDALKNAAMRGVDVRIVLPHIPDKKIVFMLSRSNYRKLINHGVHIYEFKDGFMHAKELIADDKQAIVGTINFDYRSLIHHFENGVLMFNVDILEDIKEDFNRIFAQSINMRDFKQNRLTRLFCSLLDIFRPLL